MDGVFNSIAITICGWIYPLIPPLYSVFYDLANGQFFTEGTIERLTNNLYVLVSVVMLFTFAIQLIKSIVNPDMLTDKNKGTVAFAKRAGLSLLLIVIIPWAFDQMYNIQGQILSKNLIEKVIVGFSTVKGNDEAENMADSNAGQVMAAVIISDLLYPEEGATTSVGEILQEQYNLMINKDIKKIKFVGKYINEKYSPTGDENAKKDDMEYVFHYEPLISIVAGGFTLYLLILFCLDMGVRLVKLALLEITSPISVMAYIYGGDDNLKRWIKEVSSTYIQVFVKIAALSFVIFILQNVNTFMDELETDHAWLVKLFIIIGVLTLAHKLPDLVKSLFGITYTSKGGIAGRLGEMAVVGNMAKNGWQKLTKPTSLVAAAGIAGIAASGPLGWGIGAAGLGIGAGANKLWKEKLKDTNAGRNLTAFGKTAKAFIKGGNPVNGTIDAVKAYKETDAAKAKAFTKDNARTKARNDAARDEARKASQVYTTGANGKTVIDTNQFQSKFKNDAVAAFKSTNDEMVNNKKIQKSNASVLENYNTKRHENMVANRDNSNMKQVAKNLKDYANTISNANAKQQVMNLATKVETGGMTVNDLKNQMQNISIYTPAAPGTLGGGTVTAALSTDFQNSINDLVKNVSVDQNGALYSTQAYQQLADNASTAFSAAESSYNKMLDVVSETEKASIKATANVGKDLSKAELGIK